MFRKDGGLGFTNQGSERMEGWVSLTNVQKGWRDGFHYPSFRKHGGLDFTIQGLKMDVGLGFTIQGSERMEGWVSLSKVQKEWRFGFP